ncbi:cysteine-rich receptor-like protein kinase 8, partial [Tanacetum coccineum]
MGFSPKWRKWIRGCLESGYGSVLVNGSPTKEFKIQKGLCQVDPLSPFLFIIAVEALHVTIQEAKSKNLFVGAKVGLNKIDISHLQFADDALIIGTYFFSLFKDPKCVINYLEKLRRNIFGGGSIDSNKMSWVSWKKVCSSTTCRGLGIGSLEASNLAMLTRWWRFHTHINSLWKLVITFIHGDHGGIDVVSQHVHRSSTSPWNYIMDLNKRLSGRNINLHSVFKRKVGDGSTFAFWEDLWLGELKLRYIFPRLYQLEIMKDCKVNESLFTISVAQERLRCDNDSANFTINGTYQRNLNDALSSLTSDTSIRYGFYNLSVGQIPDQVNTIALCRGDIQPNACRSCINTASAALREECPYQKAAIGWYEECWVRYTNVTILGTLDTRIARWRANGNNVSNVAQFNQALDQLLDQLRSEASRGGSLRKYASNSTNGPDFTTIYGFMQCTPDLSENQCYNCLDLAIQYIPTCCDSKRGARIFYPNCYIRYEVYRFLSATVDIALPSPPQPPSFESSPPPPPPPPGKSSNTTIVVIAVVASVSLVLLLVASVIVFLRRKRKIQGRLRKNYVHEDGDTEEIITAESLHYNFEIIREATDDFSESNKLGQGGFGLVYK